MAQDALATAATIVLLFPLGYFFLAAPGFLLTPLDIPQVGALLRGVFHAQFLMVGVASAAGTLLYLWSGRAPFAAATVSVAALAFWSRPKFLAHWDAQQDGAADFAGRLRRLHVRGMAGNAAMLAAVVGSIPYVVAA